MGDSVLDQRSRILPWKTLAEEDVWFFPSSKTILFFLLMMPALIPVSMAMQMLSPVIILDWMLAVDIFSIVYTVSDFNSFSNATKPNEVMFISNISLSPDKYKFNSSPLISLQPKAIVRYPLRESEATFSLKPLILLVELFYIFSGAPLIKL